MYAWYFPKGFQGDFSSRRHDWASAVVWIDNPALDAPKLLGVSTSTSDSKYSKKVDVPDFVITNGSTVRLNHATSMAFGSAYLETTSSIGEFQDLILWEQLTDAARTALDTVDFGDAKVPFIDANFAEKLEKAIFPFAASTQISPETKLRVEPRVTDFVGLTFHLAVSEAPVPRKFQVTMPITVPGYHTNTTLHPSFDEDIRDVHLLYDYDAEGEDGTPQKWRYEMWFFSHDRIVYSIHGGPMAGRLNYQTVAFQCIRPGELWQCNWLEETGTIVSLVYDIKNAKITTMIGFSKGHWENSKEAHGDKRNPEDYARWRKLADIGTNRDRLILSEQATILETSKGAGNLVPIAPDAETL
ncbi:hypothetical protein JM16_007061 [Phytophthora kernoviae]|uniref:Uncharacterized protein n=1 Tax=Phytophthora kernoviae TaxID=325452 RepID=A0A8T0LTD9_9STRA|nr:hypothetical protein JM16_007061 [Phytophthora kernoviae]